MNFTDLIPSRLPLLQAPMAGAQGSALALAVCAAGGVGALPAAMLSPETLQAELQVLRSQAQGPWNVNFFCHTPPPVSEAAEARWRQALQPFYAEAGLDPAQVPAGAGRVPFSHAVADLVEPFAPPVVSFHFGLPTPDLLARVKSWGSRVLSSATTVQEALWLEAHGVDAVIAQGLEAGGHRGMFLSTDLTTQVGTLALLPQVVAAVRLPVIAAGGIASAAGPVVVPDVVLVPCVGYAAGNYRLGYGGGYFDRYLAKHPHVTTVGVAWSFTELGPEQFSAQPHDIPLTLIVTERGVVS